MRTFPTLTLCAAALAVALAFGSRVGAQVLGTEDDDTLPKASNSAVENDYSGPQGPNSAVENITGKSNFFEDLFSRGSPLFYGVIAGETYDDNIFISPHKTGDFVTHVAPIVDFVTGDKVAANSNYFNIVFRPTLFFYANNSDENRVDYYVDALYQHQWTRLTLAVESRYEKLTDASIDTGNFFKRDIYTNSLTGTYDYDDHLNFTGSETQRTSFYQNQGITETSEWVTDFYASYQLTPKISLGVGPRIGYLDIVGAPDQTYQDLIFRLSYPVSEKINISFDGGAEYRQFQGDSSPSRIFPIFDFNVSYTPFDGTQLSFSGYRQQVVSDDLIGQDYLNTTVQANLKQRFLQDFFILASVGYNLAEYQPDSAQEQGPQRTDNYYFLNAGIEWDPREWLSVSARYQFSQDKSSLGENSFNDNQFDVQTSLQF
jgi:hypothetical protein